jgi:methyl-accepting chemotaxis protein
MRWFFNLRVRTKLLGAFALVVAVSTVMGLFALAQLGSVNDQGQFIGTSVVPSVRAVGEAQSAASDFRRWQLRHVLADDAAAAGAAETQIASARERMDAVIAEYERLVGSDEDRAVWGRAREQWTTYVRASDPFLAASRRGDSADAMRALGGSAEETYAALTETFGEWAQVNEALGEDALAAARSGYSSARALVLVLLVASAAIGIGVALLLTRLITRPLAIVQRSAAAAAAGDLTVRTGVDGGDEIAAVARSFDGMVDEMASVVRRVLERASALGGTSQEMAAGAEQTGQAVAQIAATVDGVAKGSGEQAESAQRVTEAVAQMSRGVGRVAGAGQQAAEAAAEADRTADTGERTVQEATAAMDRIQTSVAGVSTVVEDLGDKGREIGEIVTTISDIAEQTNLLALNAAIEAARAGEQGRGFAVVAEEVRKLAESSQEAAGSIAQIITALQAQTGEAVEAMAAGQHEVQDGVRQVDAAGRAFGDIRGQVGRVAAEVQQVADSSQELASGAQQVESSVASVAAVSEENAASAQEVAASTEETSATAQQIASASQEVARQAQELDELVRRFTV